MSNPYSDEKQSLGAVQIGAGIVGFAISRYCGINNTLLPIVSVALLWWLSQKFLSETKKPVTALFAIYAAHSVGNVAAFLFSKNPLFLVEAALCIALLIWFYQKLSLTPLYILLAYELFCLIDKCYGLYTSPVGSFEFKAYLFHAIFRSFGLYVGVALLLKLKKEMVVAHSEE